MSMNPVSRKLSDEDQKLIDEYLSKGGIITKGKSGERSENVEYSNSFYNKRKKKKEDKNDD